MMAPLQHVWTRAVQFLPGISFARPSLLWLLLLVPLAIGFYVLMPAATQTRRGALWQYGRWCARRPGKAAGAGIYRPPCSWRP